MKILFVIRDMVIGGAGKQLSITANALAQNGHQIFIYSYFGGECQHQLHSSIKYIAQNPSPNTKIKEYLLSVLHIRALMKQIQPDLAISWRCNAGCFTVLAALGLPLKTIFSERSDPFTETSILLKISAFFCNLSNGGVFQTEAVQNYYKRLKSKSVVISNPFDPQIKPHETIPFQNRKKEIVHIARMMLSQKRQDIMLKAFKLFLQKHPDYILSFYGDGDDFERVRSFAEDLNIEKSIIFHGNVLNASKKIGNTKLLVLTSDYEGIPNVIIEAFAMEVPVVSTDCSPGGARVLIDNEQNGFIVPVGDIEAIAQKMCNIVENQVLAQKFIANAKLKLEKFSPEEILTKWNNYLKSLTK